MNKKHFLLFVATSLLVSSCSVYRCRPMQHMEMAASKDATTIINEVAKPAETPQPSTATIASKTETEATVASSISGNVKVSPRSVVVNPKPVLPAVKISKAKLFRSLAKLKNTKPDEASDIFSDKNILIMSLACILAAFSTFGLLFLFASLTPAIIAFLLWLILATIIKIAIRNEFDDYEPWTKIVAIIAYSIFPILFLVWIVLSF